jgi:hypothetical protein
MLRFIGDLVERAALVFLALVFVQVPLFIQQYQQQLAGRLAELKRQVDAMKMVAHGRPLDVYIEKFMNSKDSDFSMQGEIMKGIVERYHSLSEAYLRFSEATVYSKPVIFFTHLHQDIASSTWDHFSIGLPLTIESACYAIAGIAFGMGIGKILRLLFGKGAKNELRT